MFRGYLIPVVASSWPLVALTTSSHVFDFENALLACAHSYQGRSAFCSRTPSPPPRSETSSERGAQKKVVRESPWFSRCRLAGLGNQARRAFSSLREICSSRDFPPPLILPVPPARESSMPFAGRGTRTKNKRATELCHKVQSNHRKFEIGLPVRRKPTQLRGPPQRPQRYYGKVVI